MWKGSSLLQQVYDAADLRCSDHRPVWATFTCKISVIDEALKSKLRRHLYGKRQNDPLGLLVGGMIQAGSESDDHFSPGPIAPGLPPASSDNQRWWLDTGTRPLTNTCYILLQTPFLVSLTRSVGIAVKSAVPLPSGAYMLNIFESPNPFSSPRGLDWIDLQGNIVGKQRNSTHPSSLQQSASPPLTENKPFLSPESTNQAFAILEPVKLGDAHKTESNPSKDKKEAPPIPRKPVALSLSSPQSNASIKPYQQKMESDQPEDIRQSIPGVSGTRGSSRFQHPNPIPQSSLGQLDGSKVHHGSLLDTPVDMPKPPNRAMSGCDLLDQSLDERVDWKPLLPH